MEGSGEGEPAMAWRLEHKQIQDFAKEYVGATTGVAGMAALSYSQSPHLTGVGKTVPQKQQLGTFKVPQAGKESLSSTSSTKAHLFPLPSPRPALLLLLSLLYQM